MVATVERTLSYLRCVWLEDLIDGETLETFTRQALKKCDVLHKRKLSRADGQEMFCGKHRSPKPGGILLHIFADTPGDAASVVNTLDFGKDDSDLRTAKPPKNREYLDGDIFLFIKDDHVCLCATNLRTAAATQYLVSLFELAKLPDRSRQFDLQKVADIDKVKMIQKDGVKEIALRSTLYEASMRNIDRQHALGSIAAIAKHLSAFLDDPIDHPIRRDNLCVSLSISSDLRMKGKAFGERRLKRLARDVVETAGDHDDYVIVTNSGQRISSDEIVVKKKTNIKKHGKSIECAAAWSALSEFYSDLVASGTVAQ